MKIIINGRFYSQKLTGVQRYAGELVAQLDLLYDGTDVEIALPPDAEMPDLKHIGVVRLGKHTGVVWEQTDFLRYVRKQKAVSLNLCNSAPLYGRKIVCIHDVKIKAYPEFFSRKFRMWYHILFRNITRKALALITVSDFSKEELVKYYRCDPQKINVIYNAWQHYEQIPVSEEHTASFGLQKGKYAFSLGSLEPNKNLPWILQTAKNNPDIVFAVGGGINSKVFAQDNIELPGNVRLLGYLSDIAAKSLMRDCGYFLFPSFYEGFGIPPMEAMVAGAPNIVVSDIPVMHEIFGGSVSYIDPKRYDYRLADITAPSQKYDCVLERFSWKRSARKLLGLLQRMVGI